METGDAARFAAIVVLCALVVSSLCMRRRG